MIQIFSCTLYDHYKVDRLFCCLRHEEEVFRIFSVLGDLEPVEEEENGESQRTKKKAYSHKEVCILKLKHVL